MGARKEENTRFQGSFLTRDIDFHQGLCPCEHGSTFQLWSPELWGVSQGLGQPKIGVSQAAGTVTEKRVIWAKKRKEEELSAEERSLSSWSLHRPQTRDA